MMKIFEENVLTNSKACVARGLAQWTGCLAMLWGVEILELSRYQLELVAPAKIMSSSVFLVGKIIVTLRKIEDGDASIGTQLRPLVKGKQSFCVTENGLVTFWNTIQNEFTEQRNVVVH